MRRLHMAVLSATGLALALGSLLAGCGTTGGLGGSRERAAPVAPRLPADAEASRQYLEMLDQLIAATPARQAEIVQAARLAAENAPTTMNRLRYALLLGLPGHGAADAVAARRQLSELLARPELLLPAERALAGAFLRAAEDRMVLAAENRRLQQEAATRERERTTATERRLRAEIEENQRLRRALDDARKKLEAVSQLERSITERGGTATGTQGRP